MKRLLCILDSLDTGGAETFLMKIYRAIDRDQYQIDFVVCKEGYYDEEVKEKGGKIFIISLRTEAFLTSFIQLTRIVRDNHYTSVLKLGSSPIVVTDLIAAKIGGAKRICLRSCNAPLSIGIKRQAIDALLRPLMNKITMVKIAPSDLAAEYTYGKKEVESGNVVFLNNAVDLNYYCYDLEEALNIREKLNLNGKLVVGHIGRFSRQKNHIFLVEILKEMIKLNENVVMILIGTGELEDEIRRKITELRIEKYVRFLGRRNDIPQLLSAMDVFVFPSLYEGMPNTVIEAQATGLPCLISNTITKEANITNLVEYMSLDESASKWAVKAIELCKTEVDREKGESAKILREKGYSIDYSAKVFTELCFD